jgi:trk system potassium uptake protein TrkH
MHRIDQFLIVAHDVGTIFLTLSIAACLPLVVSLLFREWLLLIPMATVPFTLLILGRILTLKPRRVGEESTFTAFGAIAVIWLVCALIGAFPFTLATGMPYIDAVFEAMSGWTSTGLSLVPSVDALPQTLLFWRTYMQWLGGIGIVAFTIALAHRSDLTRFRLYRFEGRSEALMPSAVATGLQMWKIYITLTVLSTGLLLISGIAVWDALNIAMTAISTGGFSIHTEGITFYHNRLLEMLVIPIMIAGALPFKIYYLMVRRKKISLFREEQAFLLFFLILIGTLVIFYDLSTFNHLEPLSALSQGLFMTVAGITCCGFQITSPYLWANPTVFLLTFLMMIGGSSGSTAGGIKLSRVVLWIHGQIWWFRRIFMSKHALIPFRYEGRVIPKRIAELEVSKNMLIILLYNFFIFVMLILILHFQSQMYDTSTILFEIVSAMSNVGISTGFTSPSMAYTVKLCFIITMWIGRLEVIPVIALISGILRRL